MFDRQHPLYTAVKGMGVAAIHKTITDPCTFAMLGLLDNKGIPYNSFHEIIATESFPVYSMDAYTRLEIKPCNSDKRIKLMLKDIERTDYLFVPDYIKNQTTLLQNQGLMVAEYDKGYFGTSIHPVEYTIGDVIEFESVNISELNQKYVKSITVNNNKVLLKKPDTVNINTQVFVV